MWPITGKPETPCCSWFISSNRLRVVVVFPCFSRRRHRRPPKRRISLVFGQWKTIKENSPITMLGHNDNLQNLAGETGLLLEILSADVSTCNGTEAGFVSCEVWAPMTQQRWAGHQLERHNISFIQTLHFPQLLVPVWLLTKALATVQVFNWPFLRVTNNKKN